MFKQIIFSAVFIAFSVSSYAFEVNINFHQRMESLRQQTSPALLTSEEFSELVDVAILSKDS